MNIKSVIKAKGYTLEQVAAEWKNGKGTSKGSISKMINNNPTVETLQAIADVIGCKVADFFADEFDNTPPMSYGFICPKCGAALTMSVKDAEQA